ncbi:MAG TPA: cytochrome c [Gammaproteobacteria bacterium]|jgi:cytochrome c556|nr:cytochrome c [Gammaproteobacteria bacterium]
MKKLAITLLGVVLVPLLVVSCGQGGPGSQTAAKAPEPDTPETAAFHYRDGLMKAIAWKVGKLRGMAQGEVPVDEEAFKKNSHDVVALAGMITEGFIPNSAVPGSAALPEIWMNFADFQQKANDLQNAAKALADSADQGGFEAAKGMVQAVGQTCGGCHRPYRRRQE